MNLKDLDSKVNVFFNENVMIGDGSKYGEFCVFEADVVVGRNCQIGHHVVIHGGCVIGDNVRIDDFTVIGKQPMKGKRSAIATGGTFPPAMIGEDTVIGSAVLIYAGTNIGRGCLIADQASLREDVSIGDLTIVGKGVSIENKVSIGRKVKLELGCYITALSEIGDYVFVAPMVTTTNDNYMGRTEERKLKFRGVTIRTGGRIGANSTILPGRVIGEDAVVAAGSVVTHNIPPRELWLGNPARFLRPVPAEQLLENQGENF